MLLSLLLAPTALSCSVGLPHPAQLKGNAPALPASCDRWTASRRSPWPRRFFRPHRGFSACLGRPPPWRRGTRSCLRAAAASQAQSRLLERSFLGPAHAGGARGEAHPAPTRREREPPGAASAAACLQVTPHQPAGLQCCCRCTFRSPPHLCPESRTLAAHFRPPSRATSAGDQAHRFSNYNSQTTPRSPHTSS